MTIYGLDTFGLTTVGGTRNVPWIQDYISCFGPVSPASSGNATAVTLYADTNTPAGAKVTLGRGQVLRSDMASVCGRHDAMKQDLAPHQETRAVAIC